MAGEITAHQIDIERQNGINSVNTMRINGVSETTINDQVLENKLHEIDLMEKAGLITPQEATRQRLEAFQDHDQKNVNLMRRSGVSETTINDQVYENKLREIDVLEKSGSITHEEAQRQRAEAMHNRDLKNIDIMQKSGVVSQVSINQEKERSEKQYSQNLQEIENMRRNQGKQNQLQELLNQLLSNSDVENNE